jgi:threonine-phosphate decarboxylase
LRLGCLVGPGGEIAEISRWGDPWRVNFLAQEAGLYCLRQENYIAETLKLIAEERFYLVNQIKATGAFEVFEAAANFLLIRGLDPKFEVENFQADLARMGLLVRRADNFPGLDQSYFRIAVRKRAENERLVKAINSWLQVRGAEISFTAGRDQ